MAHNFSITETEILFVMFVAAAFRTSFGFGEALIAVPLLAFTTPLKEAVPMVVLASILIAGISVVKDWRHIQIRSVGRLVLSSVCGLPIGLWLLASVPEAPVKCGLAVVIILFSIFTLCRRSRDVVLRNDHYAWIFGFAAGIFGASYGMNGPPLVMYGSLRGWSPEKFRATLQGYFLPASILGMIGFWLSGLWTEQVTALFLKALPAVALGILVGRGLNRHVNSRFIYFIHFGLLLVGIALLIQSR